MRTFRVIRDENPDRTDTAAGPTGVIGEGAEWGDGYTMIRWTAGPPRSPSVFTNAEGARTDLDRDGSRIEYDDEDTGTTGRHGAKA